MIPFLLPGAPFPPADQALEEYGGLLAVGGELSPKSLLSAYREGIFPWGTQEGWPLWYSPDPRMVLFPDAFRLSHSLAKRQRQPDWAIHFNRQFPAVIKACSQTPRKGQNGTWIDPLMQEAYCRLHELGWAHSVEASYKGELVGGLYGLAIGRVFFGESMFSTRTDASKLAFAHLLSTLREKNFKMIDCQVYTAHLASLGGEEIPRQRYLELLTHWLADPQPSRFD